jgi:hypothetical protein
MRRYVGFEVFTAVTMKNAVFWGVAPCRCGRLNRRFGGSYRLHLHGATPQKTAFINEKVVISSIQY